jgi:hypothetical protein
MGKNKSSKYNPFSGLISGLSLSECLEVIHSAEERIWSDPKGIKFFACPSCGYSFAVDNESERLPPHFFGPKMCSGSNHLVKRTNSLKQI